MTHPTDESDIRNAALEEAIEAVWRCSLVIESSVRRGDGPSQYAEVAEALRLVKKARALLVPPEPVPAPKPFTFADPARQVEHERHRDEGMRNKRGER